MKIAIIALSTFALASQATAQMIAYSLPVASTIWTAGKSAQISWTNSCNSTTGNTTFPVYLQEQQGQFQVPVPGLPELGFLNCIKPGKITVQVPLNITSGIAYSILVANGDVLSYSALFTIKSDIPGTTTSMTTTTLAPATTLAPTTTASAIMTVAPTTLAPPKPTGNTAAGALKAGSQAALVIVAAVASMML
ncbi:hypothetical protein BGX23_008022 [Mortierella sp. AD031]|nr:hypothetical protein BGX23_008022 [Mortierella sp. AD031]